MSRMNSSMASGHAQSFEVLVILTHLYTSNEKVLVKTDSESPSSYIIDIFLVSGQMNEEFYCWYA